MIPLADRAGAAQDGVGTSHPFLSVGMPAFNEAGNLPRNVPLLVEHLSRLGRPFEVIVVDDGSHDATGAIADRLAAEDERVVAVHHGAKRGIGAGVLTAIQSARGEFFMLIPADLALDLGELPKYVDADPQIDVLLGISSSRGDYSRFRKLVSWTNIWLIQTLFRVPYRQFNYVNRYRTGMLQQMDIKYGSSAAFFAEIVVRAKDHGYTIAEADIRYVPRDRGRQTGAKPHFIALTVRDLLHLWLARHMPFCRSQTR